MQYPNNEVDQDSFDEQRLNVMQIEITFILSK
jgi:hypothetical protein